VTITEEEDSIYGGLVLGHEVSVSEAVQILCCSYSNNGYASHFSTYPRSFAHRAIVYEVGHGYGYQC